MVFSTTWEEFGLGSQVFISIGILLVVYPIATVIYDIYFHPLRHFPGPWLWSATRLTFIRSLYRGNLVHDVQNIHRRYGDIVRIAPNELSFAKPQAWQDIFTSRPGHLPFPKNPVWWGKQPGQPDSLISVPNPADHARMRAVLNHGFTEKALRAQEDLIQSYIDLLIGRLREKAIAAKETGDPVAATVDICQWYNFTTFDIIGDLGFGEPFDCLRDGTYHPWVALIFNNFKASAFVAAVRFYPLLDSLLMKCLPKSVMQIQRDHYQLAVDKVHRRLNLETTRKDFMTEVIAHNDDKGMSLSEIEATFNILIIAGSETTATVLTGTTNYLLQNPDILAILVAEVRGAFKDEKKITFAALKQLPYLNAVIEEGLRLCPPIPAGLPRMVPKGGDTVCGYFLPEDTNVSVHAWTLTHSSSSFYEPTSFKPSRWLSPPPPEFANDILAASQPFSIGPRHCIGKQLAYAELRAILARMVWNFDLGLGKRGVREWASQKTWMLVEKGSFEVVVGDARG